MLTTFQAVVLLSMLHTYVSTVTAAVGVAVVAAAAASPAPLAAKAALATALFNGASLASTSVESIVAASPTSISCTIEIRNYHQDLEILEPDFYMTGGRNIVPPSPGISTGKREVCQFAKTAGSATGTCGVLSYRIFKISTQNGRTFRENGNMYLNIMWCVPYSGATNYHAIEITKGYQIVDKSLFDKLYYKGGNFIRKQAGKTIEDKRTIYGNIDVETLSVMNNENKATLIVSLR